MLCLETAGGSAKDIEDLAVFVSQLDALGVAARVHVRSVPEGLGRNVQFDLAPYLVDGPLPPEARVVVLGAHRLSDAELTGLRSLSGPEERACLGFGSFATRQARIGAAAKLSYVFGREPELFDLADGGEIARDAPVFGVPRSSPRGAPPRLLLVAPPLDDPRTAAALVTLSLSRKVQVAVLTDGRSKRIWTGARGSVVPIYQYGEALPASLVERADICVCFASLQGYLRAQCLVANLVVSGGVLVDATDGHAIARDTDAFIRGPVDLGDLLTFLQDDILPNFGEIVSQVRGSETARRCDPEPVLRFLGVEQGHVPAPTDGPLVMMPTNGVGLGHARRCALVAGELSATAPGPVFAAFPSCLRVIRSHGFDVMPLIGRSPRHAQTHENDLPNYVRLRSLTRGARGLVFDGGYVFDSVYRTILENRLTGVWIRRGLWRAEQDNSVALDREKVFARVIVPREAFEELNAAYSHGRHLREVGPVVQQAALTAEARAGLRARLAERFGLNFSRLVVSLLGGGVAADRGAQIQALCGMLERRPDTLHLVVVWPSTVLQPAWFGWGRSRVVRTIHAARLAVAADLCISAAGYNSFHEALYNRVPTIFVPQTSAMLDDQRARAEAARERQVAAFVDAHELMTLEREIGRYLDDGEAEAVRARIAALDLPEPGNAAAAKLIEEVCHGPSTVERDGVADRTAGRR